MSFLSKMPWNKGDKTTRDPAAEYTVDVVGDDVPSTESIQAISESLSMTNLDTEAPNGTEVMVSGESITSSSFEIPPDSNDYTADPTQDTEETSVLETSQKQGIGARLRSIFAAKDADQEVAELLASSGIDTHGAEAPKLASFSSGDDAGVLSEDDLVSEREKKMAEILNEIGERPKPLPFIGHLPARKQYGIALSTLTASLVIAGVLSSTGFISAAEYQRRGEVGVRIQYLMQRMLLTTQAVTSRSEEGALQRLDEARREVVSQFDRLSKGEKGMSAMAINDNENLARSYSALNQDLLPAIEQVLKISPELTVLSKTADNLNKATHTLFVSSEQLVGLMKANGSLDIHTLGAEHLRLLSERIRRNGQALMNSTDFSAEPVAEYSADVKSLKSTVDSLLKGDNVIGMPAVSDPNALAILSQMNGTLRDIGSVTEYLEKTAGTLVAVRRNLQSLRDTVEMAVAETQRFASNMHALAEDSTGRVYLAGFLVLIALGSLTLLGLVNNRLTRLESWETAFANKKTEQDIMKFMEDILPLEMGDLTVTFTDDTEAMDGITGGIRSSVNEAVSSLRAAVAEVKKTTGSVIGTVQESVDSSKVLQDSNHRQANEIGDVVNRVSDLTGAIEQVTENTVRAAEMTVSAKVASDAGAQVVAETNAKMGEIRFSMQQVLKSVKHLGETSHEIGTIVEAIETITDRTQVLAVNASLEAAKAGAAGQGFQVLAGEVNRLAEQSNEALRTITALVQRIQGETASTIKVVEDSTSSVVEGARLSEAANEELTKISMLSDQLHAIMGQIRDQSENQSNNAGSVRESMERLQFLSKRFHESVSQMVHGVQQIDASMGSLQNTVGIFNTETPES